jgi:hypothetical protein
MNTTTFVIHFTDPVSGYQSFVGPFPTASAAEAHAAPWNEALAQLDAGSWAVYPLGAP